jgi:transcriptional regulator with XRE-family HTH domain
VKNSSIARRIKSLRLKLNLTQEQFAQKVGVSFSTVNEWERGKRTPSPLALRQLEALIEKTDTKKR